MAALFDKLYSKKGGMTEFMNETDIKKDELKKDEEVVIKDSTETNDEQEIVVGTMPNLHEIQITTSMEKLTKAVNTMKAALTKKQMARAFEAVLAATYSMDDLTITMIDMVESSARIYGSRVRFDEARDGIGGKKKMIVVNPASEK